MMADKIPDEIMREAARLLDRTHWDRSPTVERVARALMARDARLQEQVETLQYKAEKYDAVVKALSVCDGGRYRNDTIESCILALKAREVAKVERDRLREALHDVRAAIMDAEPSVLVDTLWMPDSLYRGGTVVDFIDAALQREPQP